MDDFYLNKVCQGDEDAFRYFIKTYKDMAYNIAISIVKDEFAAQEVVQDAFIRTYRNLHSFHQKSAFSTWFYRIVMNEALMRLRKTKKEIISYTGEYPEEKFDDRSVDGMDVNEQAYIINEALKKLPPNESLALRLFYLQEEKIKEVCEITGWTEGNAKVILHRARKNMFSIVSKLMKQNL